MNALLESPGNRERVLLAQEAWSELIQEALRRGFHGVATLELHVQDGSIQQIRQRVERLLKTKK